MSRIPVQAMEGLWFLHILAALFPVHAAHQVSPGLICTNDFVNNVSCTWSGSRLGSGKDCWISGVKKVRNHMTQQLEPVIQSCELKEHGNSPPGCSLVFENTTFFSSEGMPRISIRCGNEWMENLTNYRPVNHIKMHPPGTPSVSSTSNGTWISWTPGSPVSYLFKSKFNFQVQIKQSNQLWRDAMNFSVPEQELRVPTGRLTGEQQVRVRVMPTRRPGSQWSHWSPTTTWVEVTVDIQDWWQVQISLIVAGVVLCLCLNIVLILIFYKCCQSRGLLKEKPVPNPSKYFQTLQSVHEGNLKKWLNPVSLPESFFTVQPCEEISPVEVCKDWDVVPSPSQSLTSTLLHFQSYPSSASNINGVVYNSSSMSNFSNMGYFMSSSCSSSAQSHRSPAYFTYEDDFQHLPKSHNLNLSLCLPLASCPSYESLKREPVSPDSGFGIENENEQNEAGDMDKEEEELFKDQSSPILILPVHIPTSFPPVHPQLPTIVQTSSDNLQVDVDVDVDVDEAAASESSASWLVTGGVCRSSSMPVEPCKTGYLTLKELQTTFSNKSI